MSTEDNDYIPDFEEFQKEIVKIYSIGDMQKGYKDMLFHINNHKDSSGNRLTWEFIRSQYELHISWWDYMYKKKENSRFLKADAEAKRYEISPFIVERMYNRVWVITRGTKERNDYIFGKLPIEELMRQLKEFKQLWIKKRPELENTETSTDED